MFDRLRKLFWQIVARFRDGAHATPPEVPPDAGKNPRPEKTPSPASPEPSGPPPGERPLPPPAAAVAVGPEMAEKPAAEAPQAQLPAPAKPAGTRQQRRQSRSQFRRLERARLRHDVWVTPQGEKPAARLRAAPEPGKIDKSELVEPAPEPAPAIEEANFYMVDKLHYDEDVLVEETELYGEFNFRDTILDQLDRYWVYLDRMRKRDPDAYGLYKQIGATLIPHAVLRTWEGKGRIIKVTPEELEDYKRSIILPASFKKNRPSFGCVVYGANSLTEKKEMENKKVLTPKFVHYTKCSKPGPEVQPMTGGDTYKLTVWWDKPFDKKYKWGTPTEFAVHINTAGDQIHVLRLLQTKMISIQEKHKLKHFQIPKRAWRIPEFYEDWAADHGIPVELYLAGIFCDAVKLLENSCFSTLRVAVHKDDMTAIFGLDPRRMSYFFRDRDYKLNANGHRIPVFHIVKPYTRSDGVAVKMQFRGDRDFTWAGYRVTITVPGLDHFMFQELNIGTVDSYWQEKNVKYLSEEEFGKKLVSYMDKGVGAYRKA